jgi:3-dehydroquinate dehydratase-1
MRIQSERKIHVRSKTIGGSEILVCLPLVANTRTDLLRDVKELLRLAPDIVEWRIDGFDQAQDIDKSLATLYDLRKEISSIPLIFTCRIDTEGGIQTFSRDTRLNLILKSIKTGLVDLIDIELINDVKFIDTIVAEAKQYKVNIILSYHNFEKTPDEDFILKRLLRAQTLGADIAKVAVMPNSLKDVLTLLNATLKARTGKLKIPLITMSMGVQGIITRLAGGLWGSDITFAIGKNASAPGQIPIEDLRKVLAILYHQQFSSTL